MDLNQWETLRLLIIGNDEVSRLAIKQELRQANGNIEIECADTIISGLSRLGEKEFACLLIDAKLLDSNALNLLKKIRLQGISTPVLILTLQEDDERIAPEALSTEALSYLSKDLLSTDDLSNLGMGADAFVAKPSKPEALLKEIAGLLQSAGYQSIQPLVPELPDTDDQEITINLNYLRELAGGDIGFMKQMITLFMEQTPGQLKSLKTYCVQQQWHDLKALAHKMKSSAGLLSITPLQQLLTDLQMFAGQQIHLEQIPAMVKQVSSICERVIKELQFKLQSLE